MLLVYKKTPPVIRVYWLHITLYTGKWWWGLGGKDHFWHFVSEIVPRLVLIATVTIV